jgi:hypothetical protein
LCRGCVSRPEARGYEAVVLAVSTLPFVMGVVLGIALFAAFTWLLILDEARHPVQWRSTALRTEPRLSHTRLAAICLLFALWSLWATARPVSGWR